MIDGTVRRDPMLVTRKGKAMAGFVALLLVLLLAGCSSGDDSGAATTQGAQETTAPAEGVTEPADDETAEAEEPSDDEGAPAEEPSDDEGAPAEEEAEPTDEAAEAEPDFEPAEVPVWSWVAAGLLLLAAVVWMATRSGSASRDDESDVN